MKVYEKPVVTDYGTLVDVTASTTFQGPEDGAMKVELVVPHHSIVGP